MELWPLSQESESESGSEGGSESGSDWSDSGENDWFDQEPYETYTDEQNWGSPLSYDLNARGKQLWMHKK